MECIKIVLKYNACVNVAELLSITATKHRSCEEKVESEKIKSFS